jgi:DinB family protein
MARTAPAGAALEALREQLASLLHGDEAHMSFEDAVAAFPAEAMNERAPNVTYTPWHILEHLRITQWDILEYMRDPRGHRSPDWPVGYWPARDATTTPEGFKRTVEGFIADRAAVEAIVRDLATDLLAVLPGTPGHTVLREVTILGNHNSYHVGEFAALRQVMGSWPARRRR